MYMYICVYIFIIHILEPGYVLLSAPLSEDGSLNGRENLHVWEYKVRDVWLLLMISNTDSSILLNTYPVLELCCTRFPHMDITEVHDHDAIMHAVGMVRLILLMLVIF